MDLFGIIKIYKTVNSSLFTFEGFIIRELY